MPDCRFTTAAVKEKSKEISIYNRLYAIIHKNKPTKPRDELYTHPTLPVLPGYWYYRRAIPELCTSNPLNQTEVLPLGELDFHRLFLLPPTPGFTPEGSTPVSMMTTSSTTADVDLGARAGCLARTKHLS